MMTKIHKPPTLPSEPFPQRVDPPTKHHTDSTPIRLMVATTICVFAAEALIMMLLSALPPLDMWITVFLDATLIVLFVIPVLYFSLFKPLQQSLLKRIQTEQSARVSESKFRSYTYSSPDAMIVADNYGSIVDVNDATMRISGYSREELLKMNISRFFPDNERQEGIEHFSKVLKTGKSSGIVPIVIKSGAKRYWEIEAVALGEKRLLGFMTDVTPRMETARALKESEEKFRTLVEHANVIPWRFDLKKNRFTFIGQQVERILGFPVESWTDLDSWADRIHPDDRQAAVELCSLSTEKGDDHNFEYRCLSAEGRIVWIRDVVTVRIDEVGEPFELVGFMLDITPIKRAEDELRKNERKLIEAQRIAHLGHYLLDVETGCWTSSSELDNIYGIDEHYAKNVASWLDIVHPEHREMMLNYFQDDVLSQNHKFDKEYKIVDIKTGQEKWVHGLGDLKCDEYGQPIQMFGTIQDITDRKRIEEALKESEEKYRLVFETAANLITSVDSEGTLKDCNNRIEEVLGYTREELIGKNMGKIIHPDYHEKAQESLTELITTGTAHNKVYKVVRKDGRIIDVRINSSSITDEQGHFVRSICIVDDITETKRLQALESRAARLETAGTIAGQVAHDFNNLLAPIMAYPELIRDGLPADSPFRKYLEEIEYAAQKIADINQDLLTMGRRGHYIQEVLDLNVVVRQTAQEMELGTNTVTVEMDLCQDLMNIKGGIAQIHRMLINLLVNAQDAISDIGEIFIKTENYRADDISVAFGRVPKGEYVKLTVSDNGCGIAEDVIENILDPFFSTKTADKKRGSGLGLSIVDAVMKDHEGYLDMASKVGQGTSFYLYFPVTRDDITADESEDIAGGKENILIVDDDKIQREVTSQLLTKLGYNVNSVESGEIATEFIRDNPQNLVILDMVMAGGMDGTETYRRMLEFNPDQKAILLSGYSESDRVIEAQQLGAGAFVRKPVTKSVIAVAVRRELDRQAEVATH